MEEIIVTDQSSLNLFFNIWVRPRSTIRHIIDTDPTKHVIILAIISGIYQTLDRAASNSLGDDLSLVSIIVTSLIGGAIGGIISLYIGGVLFRWSGSLFGGKAKLIEVRAALAWSSVPDIVLLIVFVPIIIIYGRDWFTSSTAWMDANEAMFLITIVILTFFGLILVAWKAIIVIKCLAEVHQFSAWRGLASFLIGFLVILIPVIIFILA